MKNTVAIEEIDQSASTLVFNRTPLSRLVSCAAVVAAGAVLFLYLSHEPSEIRLLPLIGCVVLLAGTVTSALLHYGDRVYVSPDGLLFYNRWLSSALSRVHWMKWDEVVEVREIRRRILVLLAGDGRRILIDAITGYRLARTEILRRVPHAVISGTLEKKDRP